MPGSLNADPDMTKPTLMGFVQQPVCSAFPALLTVR